MATKSPIQKISEGVGLEDPEVRAYVEDKKRKQDARIERYSKENMLMRAMNPK